MQHAAQPLPAGAPELPVVLKLNNTAEYVTPSIRQYVHQWLWDSAFHAMILARYDPPLAQREILSLLKGQWPDGMIPHVRFHPDAPDAYRPNIGDWGTERPASGITQPPLIASAIKAIFKRDRDRAFLRRVYEPVCRYHAWLKAVRDADHDGLLAIVHPWESGTDNSPAWDTLRDRFLKTAAGSAPIPPRADTRHVPPAQRPSDDDYRFYWALIALFKRWRWNQKVMARRSPFLVADTLFNSVWAKANWDLALIADALGRHDDAKKYRRWAAQTRAALHRLFRREDRFFYPLDLKSGKLLTVKTSSGFLPLLARAATPAMARHLAEHLLDRREFYHALGVPSTSFDEPAFDRQCYWRGPIWINIHWLINIGLKAYGYHDLAHELAQKSRRLVAERGYWEYYQPFTGEGMGAPEFTWSALADVMAPSSPPPELEADVLVMPHADAERNPELAALYANPDTVSREPGQVDLNSGPVALSKRLIEEADRELGRLGEFPQAGQFGATVQMIALVLKRLVQERRGVDSHYLRFCDLGAEVTRRTLHRLGYTCRTMWTRDLHYFALVDDPANGPWVVDLSGEQFIRDPVSRLPLLLATATVALGREMRATDRSWLLVEAVLDDTRDAVEAVTQAFASRRLNRPEREAFQRIINRHRRTVRQAGTAVRAPPGYVHDYLGWLDTVSSLRART